MSVFIATTFLSCNRHYLSQLIAGVGFGAVYALSASKVVDFNLKHNKDIKIEGHYDSKTQTPSLTISWRF